MGKTIIFSTHRELFRLRPHWRSDGEEECRGALVISDESMTVTSNTNGEKREPFAVWEATCDGCGLEVGIPPRQQEKWSLAQLVSGGES